MSLIDKINTHIQTYIDDFIKADKDVNFLKNNYAIPIEIFNDKFRQVIDAVAVNLNKPLQIVLNIRLNPGVTLDDDLPYLNLAAEIQLIDYELVSHEDPDPDDGIAGRFSISTSFFTKPFENICACAQIPKYMIPPNMNIFVQESYRNKQVPRLLISMLVCLLEKLFPDTFTDAKYLYIDADGSTAVKPENKEEGVQAKSFWEYIGMVSNEDNNVSEHYSEGYEKKIQVCGLKQYLFKNLTNISPITCAIEASDESQCVRQAKRSKQTSVNDSTLQGCGGRTPYYLRSAKRPSTLDQNSNFPPKPPIGGSAKTRKKSRKPNKSKKIMKRNKRTKRNISLKKRR